MARVKVGESSGTQGAFQKWYLVNDDERFQPQTLNGIIETVGRNIASNYQFMVELFFKSWIDGDWNLWVRPNQSSKHLLTNSNGEKNHNDQIEVEVNNPALDMQAIVHPGMSVRCKGWWVEDTGHTATDPNESELSDADGHRGKTEIHPFDFLVAGHLGGDRFAICMTQDRSGRFIPANWAISESFDIPIGRTSRYVNVGIDGTSVATTEVLSEVSQVDTTSKSMGSSDSYVMNSWMAEQTRVRAWLMPENIFLWAHLNAGGMVQPFWLGKFDRFEEDLMTVTTSSAVVPGPGGSGTKIYKVELEAALADPTQMGIKRCLWQYTASSAFGSTQQVQELQETGPYRVKFQLLYSPAEGWPESEWRLHAVACTREEDWSPNIRSNAAQIGEIAPESRIFVGAKMALKVEPSRVEVDVERVYATTTASRRNAVGPAGRRVKCHKGYRIRFDSKFLANVNGNVGWRVAVVQASDGTELPTPPVINSATSVNSMTPGVPVDFGHGFTISIVNSNEIEIDFDDDYGSILGSGVYMYAQNNNQVRIIVTGYLESELGEYHEASTGRLGKLGCIVSGQSWEEFYRDLVIYAHAIEILTERGIPIHPWPEPRLRRIWKPDKVRTEAMMRRAVRRLPKKFHDITDVFDDLAAGRAGQERAIKKTLEMASRASSLAPLRFPSSDRDTETLLSDERTTSRNDREIGIVEVGSVKVVKGLKFHPNSARAKAGAKQAIQPWLHLLRGNEELKAAVIAHTHGRRARSDPFALTRRRVQAIQKMFEREGIDRKRIRLVSAGNRVPRLRGSDSRARHANDRVEVVIY